MGVINYFMHAKSYSNNPLILNINDLKREYTDFYTSRSTKASITLPSINHKMEIYTQSENRLNAIMNCFTSRRRDQHKDLDQSITQLDQSINEIEMQLKSIKSKSSKTSSIAVTPIVRNSMTIELNERIPSSCLIDKGQFQYFKIKSKEQLSPLFINVQIKKGKAKGYVSDRHAYPALGKADMYFYSSAEYYAPSNKFHSDHIFISVYGEESSDISISVSFITPIERSKRIKEKIANKNYSGVVELEKTIKLLKTDKEYRSKYETNIGNIRAKRIKKLYIDAINNHLLSNITNPKNDKAHQIETFQSLETNRKSSVSIKKKEAEKLAKAIKLLNMEKSDIKNDHVLAYTESHVRLY